MMLTSLTTLIVNLGSNHPVRALRIDIVSGINQIFHRSQTFSHLMHNLFRSFFTPIKPLSLFINHSRLKLQLRPQPQHVYKCRNRRMSHRQWA